MKKINKIAIVAFICLLVVAVSSCELFTSMGNVVVNVRNGGGIADTTSNYDYDVYAYLFAVDDEGNYVRTNSLEKVKQTRVGPGQEISFSFKKNVRTGTTVKVVIGINSRGANVANRCFVAESEPLVIQEGSGNTAVFGSWEETTERWFIY